jgi:hypothetical protein
MDDVGPRGLALVGGAQDVHGNKRRDNAAAGLTQSHAVSCARRLLLASGFRYEELPIPHNGD